MTAQHPHYDVLIAGGGMVGASLARALAGSGLRVGVVEPVTPRASSQPSYDDRVIALSWGSRLILQAMGRWEAMRQDAEAIRRIHISDRGHFGFAHMDSESQGVTALGYVISARAIGQGLLHGVAQQDDLDWLSPARILGFEQQADYVRVQVDIEGQSREVCSRLLVASDGVDSPIRRQLGVPVVERDYGHTAVIANVTPGKPHAGIAYERFTDSGPLAMLPMTEGRCSLVWTRQHADAKACLALDDEAFLEALQERFGFRLGRLQKVGQRAAYPLRLMRVKQMSDRRVVLIGNAAHTLHPVSGQGFNLGLRDVSHLAEVLHDAAARGSDPGSEAVVSRYVAGREPDQRQVAGITDGLAQLFINPLPPVRLGRNLGLLAMDLLPSVKKEVTRQFMGLRGWQPRLSRGLSLEN